MDYLLAFGLTLVVECPLYWIGLRYWLGCSGWLAAALSVGVNVISHPILYFVLAPWLEVDPNASIAGRGAVSTLLAETGEVPTRYPAEALW